jgi:hypothetical protein
MEFNSTSMILLHLLFACRLSRSQSDFRQMPAKVFRIIVLRLVELSLRTVDFCGDFSYFDVRDGQNAQESFVRIRSIHNNFTRRCNRQLA